MPLAINGYRVFIASPGGMQQERNLFRKTIMESNEDAVQRGALFIPVGWEDTLGGMGRPQGIINQELRECDYLVLLLWDRWGTPTGAGEQSAYSSGTEEEFRVARECFGDPGHPLRQIVAFFKAVAADKLSDPGPQLQRVLDFKRELETSKSILFHTFDDAPAFDSHLRRHLAKWLRDHDRGINTKARPRQGTSLPEQLPGATAPSARESNTSDDLKDSLDEAERLADQGYATDAEAIYARCITKYKEPDAFNRYGVFLMRNDRLSQAEVMFQQVEGLAEKSGEKWRSVAFINLGLLCRIRLDLAAAESFYRNALDIDLRLGREKGVATALGSLGTIAQIRGDLQTAEQRFQEALKVSERAQWLKGMASEHCNIGMLKLKRGELVDAQASLAKALELEQRLGRLEGVADASSGLGLVYQTNGQLDLAERMHTQALKINEQLGRQAAAGDQYADLGIVYLKKGALPEAESALRKALEMSERSGRQSSIANVHNYLGLVLREKGDLDQAERMHFDALRIYAELGLRDFMADQYSHIGSIYEARGALDKALSHWRTAARLFAEVQQSGKIELLDSWALALTGRRLIDTGRNDRPKDANPIIKSPDEAFCASEDVGLKLDGSDT